MFSIWTSLKWYTYLVTKSQCVDVPKKSLENIVGKGENAGNQHFLPFPQCFSVSLKIPSIWTKVEFVSTGKGF